MKGVPGPTAYEHDPMQNACIYCGHLDKEHTFQDHGRDRYILFCVKCRGACNKVGFKE